jgi:hypothetical protein
MSARHRTLSFGQRLTDEAERLRNEARGVKRDRPLQKARQPETTSNINGWLSSRELQPPK